MRTYYLRTSTNSEAVSDNFIYVNNLGYIEDAVDMNVRRERGRVDYQLIYVKSGEIIIEDDNKKHILTSGTICLFRPNEPQIYSVKKTLTTYFWIHFSGTEVENMLTFFKEKSYLIGQFPEIERFCHGYSTEFQSEQKYIDLLYEGELITVIARIAERINADKKQQNDLSKIRPALEAIRSTSGLGISNAELANLCCLSKYYFMKLFKKITGVSPQQYYVEQVIEKSCYLLLTTSYNVREISDLCGINDSLYFSRLFKKHTGFSPVAYRKNFSY